MIGDSNQKKKKLLIFIVAYNAEKTIANVITRIPKELNNKYDISILIIDDASQDQTFQISKNLMDKSSNHFPLISLKNPINQGYGGNQKIGFFYAIKHNYDIVALIHGDGQYAPECLDQLLDPINNSNADVVFGSRMLTRFGALKGNMPLYKYLGNKVLTKFQNFILKSQLSEFHSGYRVYSVDSLRSIPFELNSDVFHFDTEIIIQLMFAKKRIKELPIPTYYGNEISHVNGIRYAWDVFQTTLKARAQKFAIYYDPKFDIPIAGKQHYVSKVGFPSSHSETISRIEPNSRVIDIGGASGMISKSLKRKNCIITGIDINEINEDVYDEFINFDLNKGPIPIRLKPFKYVLLLDVIEHLMSPEKFVSDLRKFGRMKYGTKILVSVPNTAFLPMRISLLIGIFNYGKRGILDKTHTRLFTLDSIMNLFVQNGYDIKNIKGIPVPFGLIFGDKSFVTKILTFFNMILIKVWKRIFSYQFYLEVRQRPTLEQLLDDANQNSYEN